MIVSYNQNSFKKSPTAFTSRPIHQVNLLKIVNGKEDGFVKAIFSNINPADTVDQSAIELIKKTWGNSNSTISSICNDFLDNKHPDIEKFQCIELIDSKPLGEKIVGLVKYYFSNPKGNKNLHLALVATKPDVGVANPQRQLKGVGEIIMGELFSSAKNAGASTLDFTSSNDTFYVNTFKNAKINITDDKIIYSEFAIDKKYFDKYINYCRNKYGLNI